MKKQLTSILISAGMMIGAFVALITPLPVSAQTGTNSTPGINVFSNCDGAAANTTSGKQICGAKDDGKGFNKLMQNIINTTLFVLGVVAVIMIIFGGIRYTTSNGDASSVKAAKDTVLYAVIGLVVAIMAYAIVNFVLARLGGNNG